MHGLFSRWLFRALFVLTVFVIVALDLTPMNSIPSVISVPDLVYCLTAAWLLRREDYLPVYLVIAVFLFVEMVFGLPLGLWVALMLASTEYLRARVAWVRQLPFIFEWLLVSATYSVAFLVYQLVLVLTFSQPASFDLAASHLFLTIIVYPVVALTTNIVFRIRKITPTEAELLHGVTRHA